MDQVQSALAEMYQHPETIFHIMEVFNSCGNASMQVACAVGLNEMLRREGYWDGYCTAGIGEAIKTHLLVIVRNVQDVHVLKNVVRGLSPVLERTKTAPWPEYVQLFTELASKGEHLMKTIVLLNAFLEHAKIEQIHGMWGAVCGFAMTCLATENPDVIAAAADTVARLCHFAEDISTGLPELVLAMFSRLEQLMSVENVGAGDIISAFDVIAESDLVLDFNVVAGRLATLACMEALPIDQRVTLFEPIAKFSEKGKIDAIMEPLIDSMFMAAMQAFEDSMCLGEQENMDIVLDLLYTLLKCGDEEIVYGLVRLRENGKSPTELVVYVRALMRVVKLAPAIYQQEVLYLVRCGFNCIKTGNHCVQEGGFKLLKGLFERPHDAFGEIDSEMMELIFQCMKIQHEPLLEEVLACLGNFLSVVSMTQEMIVNVFRLLAEVLTAYPLSLKANVIDCLTALAQSEREDIAPIRDPLIGLVSPCLSMNKPEETRIKASALRCMSVVFRFAGCAASEPIVGFIGHCVELLHCEDEMLMAGSFAAVTELVIARRPEVAPVIGVILESVHKILSSKPDFRDDEDDQELNEITAKVWGHALNVMAAMAKYIPEAIPGVVAVMKEDIYGIIDDGGMDDKIMISAVHTLLRLTIVAPGDAVRFVHTVVDNVDGFGEDFSVQCFHCLGKLITSVPSPDEVVGALGALAMQSMKRELGCGTDELANYDMDLGGEVYLLLRIIARSYPHVFPSEFMTQIQKVCAHGVPFEVAEAVGALACYFSSAHERMGTIEKKFTVRKFVETLSICDFSVPPEPIAAIRVVVECDPHSIASSLDQVFTFIDQALASPYEGQLMFHMTMDYIVSLLFSLFRCVLKEQFNVPKYMAKMLSLLPVTSPSPSEADNIYISLAFVCSEYPAVMGPFGIEVIRVLAQMLSAKEKDWQNIGVSVEIARACAVLLTNLTATLGQGNEILSQSVPNEIPRRQLTARLAALTTQ